MKSATTFLTLFLAPFLLAEESPTIQNAAPEPVEIAPKNMHPAFTRGTVIRLNAIVRKSLDTIEQYDRVKRGEKSETLPNLLELNDSATKADQEMKKEVARLKASKEVYNETLLNGMILFVQKVHQELSEAAKVPNTMDAK